MKKTYPTIGAYNQTIQKKGGAAFRTLKDLVFVPARTMPIKVYLFGSGSYAVVFKVRSEQKTSAIRCFLTTEQENIDRYKIISDHLKTIDTTWKVDCTFLDNEINVEDNLYPVLKMDWIEGQLINQFVTANLHNNQILSELQAQLVAISDSLEQLNMGHGDLQSGNIMVQQTSTGFQLKLIDYDGMFVPAFRGRKSLENGRTEFQHPKRNPNIFSPFIDRFSFWVMLTALEAIKYDKSLWQEVMQGGFNTLDNFLFTIADFKNPNQSALFHRLKSINNQDVNFYGDKLKYFSISDFANTEKPVLAKAPAPILAKLEPTITATISSLPDTNKLLSFKDLYILNSSSPTHTPQSKTTLPHVSDSQLLLVSTPIGANVLTSTFKKLGNTPLTLDKNTYIGKTLLLSLGNIQKKITISDSDKLIEVSLSD